MATEVSPPKINEQSAPSRSAAEAAGDVEEISLLDLLIVLAARKRFIFYMTAAIVIASVIISLLLPARYTATSTILPPQQNSSVGALLTSQLASMGGMAALAGGSFGLKSQNELLVSMMKSRTVEDAMVKRFNLRQEYHSKRESDARKSLEKNAVIDGSGKDGLIRISIEDRDAKRAAELTNGYVQEFRELSDHLAITEASQRRLFFEQQLKSAKDNLSNAEEALKGTEQKTGLIQLDSQARALIESAASLRAQIAAKEVEIKSIGTFATAQNSQVVQAQQELSSLRAQLGKLVGSGNDSDDSLIVPKGRVPEVGLEYVRKLRDVKYYETIFDILAKQFEIAKLDEAKEGAIVQIVDVAVPPDRRSFPKRALIVLVSAVVGFILAVFVVLVRAGYEHVSEDEQTREKLTLFRQLMRHRSKA